MQIAVRLGNEAQDGTTKDVLKLVKNAGQSKLPRRNDPTAGRDFGSGTDVDVQAPEDFNDRKTRRTLSCFLYREQKEKGIETTGGAELTRKARA